MIMNYETEIIGGHKAIVRHIFKREELKVGQKWIGGSGNVVTIEDIKVYPSKHENDKPFYDIYYSWYENGVKKTHDKDHFAFQCRYCLIVDEDTPDTVH